MKTLRIAAIGIGAVIVVYLLLIAFMPDWMIVGFRFHWPWSKSVSEKIAAQIASGAATIDVGRLADFEWDQVFVFAPYAFPQGMCDTIQLPPGKCSAAHFSNIDENHFFLVFMRGQQIVRKENFSRTIGNFDAKCCWKGVPRANAQFKIRRESSYVYLVCSG
jgi:hypothetical protein